MHLDMNYRNRDIEMPALNSSFDAFRGSQSYSGMLIARTLLNLAEASHVKIYVTKILGRVSLGKMIHNPDMNTQK